MATTDPGKREGKKNNKASNDNQEVNHPKKERAKNKTEQEEVKKVGFVLTQQKKQQEEQIKQVEAGRQRMEKESKLQSETQGKTERGQDEKEPEAQRENSNRHLLEDRKQEGKNSERRDKKEKVQRNVSGGKERKAENQKETSEKLKETEEEEKVENKSQKLRPIKKKKDKTESEPQRGDANQHVLEASKQKAGAEDKKGECQEGNQSHINVGTAEKQSRQTETLPPVNREATARTDLRTPEGPAKTQKQDVREENKLQTEREQEEPSQRSESSRQPAECQDGAQGGTLDTNTGVSADGSQREVEKRAGPQLGRGQLQAETQLERGGQLQAETQLERGGQLQAETQLDMNPVKADGETTEQPEQRVRLTDRGAERLRDLQGATVGTDSKQDANETQRKVSRLRKQRKHGKELNVDQQQTVRKRKQQDRESDSEMEVDGGADMEEHEVSVLQKRMRMQQEAQNENQMEVDIAEPQSREGTSQQDQTVLCQEDQQELIETS
uniref:trichohyalin-like n=1 Tax=Monopterus albus TaxID=43700 RepID=UPI0009B4B2C0|nr:trichohyalin-like [Monopterus albus]